VEKPVLKVVNPVVVVLLLLLYLVMKRVKEQWTLEGLKTIVGMGLMCKWRMSLIPIPGTRTWNRK
jgi:hypothetical protein